MRGSIQTDMSEHYREQFIWPAILQSYHNEFKEMTMANKAHTIMLYDCGIIDKEAAGSILAALEDIWQNLKEEDLSAEEEDFYFNVEKALIARVGSDTGGRMHTARSRNDLGAGITRMVARRSVWNIVAAALSLRGVITDLAEEHAETVMTGYTHLQPAQPTTLGHFFSSYAEVLGRDIDRLMEAYAVTNRSPFGAAAFAGTGFPISRETVSDLLGFDGLLQNTWDSVSARDFMLQIEAASAILLSSLSRVAQDIHTWCTNEFGIWKLGHEIANQSSIMPQKVNPAIIEFMRAKPGHVFAAFSSAFFGVGKAPFSLCCDLHESDTLFLQGVSETIRAMDMMEEVLRYSTFDKERALELSKTNFCTVTELADRLVRTFGISFRDAHHIVGGMVADARAAGLDVRGMAIESFEKWCQAILGRTLPMTAEALAEALEPAANVQSKNLPGGPNPDRVREMAAAARADIARQEAWLAAVVKQVEVAYERTEREAARVLGA